MSYSIRVQKSQGAADLLARNFNTREEFQTVADLCDNKRRIGWLESLIVPVRTDTLNNFCKDFFLPGFFNQTLTTNDLASRIFIAIMMPIYDILTLRIRLITLIPRYIYNALYPKESHPFYQYLINNGVAPNDLSAGHVYLEKKWIEGRRGLGEFEADRNLATQGHTFNFMHLPEYVSPTAWEFNRRGIAV